MSTTSIKAKVNRIGLVGQIVSIFLIVLMAIAIFALIAGGIVLAVLPKDAVTVGVATDMEIMVGNSLIGPYLDRIPDESLGELHTKMRVNGTEFVDMEVEKTAQGLALSAATDRVTFDLSRFFSMVLAGVVYCGCLLVIFLFLKRLSDGFRRCDTPFADDVVKRMSVFAWVLLGCAVVSGVAESIANALMLRSFDLNFSLNPSELNTGFEFSMNFAPIFLALIVLFLAMIFRYGAQLQKESDETL